MFSFIKIIPQGRFFCNLPSKKLFFLFTSLLFQAIIEAIKMLPSGGTAVIYEYKLLKGECFWGGSTADGLHNPYTEESDFSCDFRIHPGNQTMPLLVSNKGRYIWSESLFNFTVKNGVMTLPGKITPPTP